VNDHTDNRMTADLPPGAWIGRPSVRITVGATLGLALLIAAAVWGEHAARPVDGWLVLDVAIGIAGCALVPVLVRWPVPGALALAVLAAVSPAATPPATAGTLIVAQRRRLPVAAAVAAAGVLAHVVRGAWRPAGGLSLAWWLVLVLVAHAALVGWGALSRSRRALIASLRERARRAEADQARLVAEARALERTQIAREMHDVLAHRLSLLATYAGALEYRPHARPEDLSRAAGVIRESVHQALGDLRDVITLLRDDDLAGGADDRPQPALTDLPELLAQSRSAGADVQLQGHVSRGDALPAATGRTTYRIVQEALTNARKHASGQPVRVVLDGRPGDGLTIEIRNPMPAGSPLRPLVPGSGMGLVGLTERARLAGGRLDHRVTAGGEFRLHAWLPWPA
jgi:signal transduction histidine kinase